MTEWSLSLQLRFVCVNTFVSVYRRPEYLLCSGLFCVDMIEKNWSETDIRYMEEAVALAERGRGFAAPNPVVGCVIVKDGRAIGRGWHRRYGGLHAEREALADCRENPAGATAYVTLEPCVMCTGAIILSRVDRVVYGAQDLKTGAHESAFHLLAEPLHNHVPEVTGGVLRKECGDILTNFFKMRRMEKKARKMRERAERESALAADPEAGGVPEEC